MNDDLNIEAIKEKKDSIMQSIELMSAIKDELTSDETSPIITKISEFLEVANSNPIVIQIMNDIKLKKSSLKTLEEEALRYEKRTKEAQSLQQYYFSLIQKQFPEVISK